MRGFIGLSLCAEVIANDRPLVIRYEGRWYFPVVQSYPETTFGGVFPTETVYRDPALIKLISDKGQDVFPIRLRGETAVAIAPAELLHRVIQITHDTPPLI